MKRAIYIAIAASCLMVFVAIYHHSAQPIYTIRERVNEVGGGNFFARGGETDLSIIYVYDDSTIRYWTNWEISERSTNKWHSGMLSRAARAQLDELMTNPNAEHRSGFDIYPEWGRQWIPDEIKAVAKEAKSTLGVEREERELFDFLMKYK